MKFVKKHVYLAEVLLWIAGVALLATMDPAGQHIFSFCPFSWMLENLCPGCGLGHAIAFMFRGDLMASWEAHSLGVPAIIILLWRCGQLLHWHFKLNYL